jgi:Ubiquitin family
MTAMATLASHDGTSCGSWSRGILEKGYAVGFAPMDLAAKLQASREASDAVFSKLSGGEAFAAHSSLGPTDIDKIEGYLAADSGGSAFWFRKGMLLHNSRALPSLTSSGFTTRAEASMFSAQQGAICDALAQVSLSALKSMGALGAALVPGAEKGLLAGSGGGLAGASSISSLSVHRLEPYGTSAATKHIDCSLLTAVAVPFGDRSFELYDKRRGTSITPGTMLSASSSSASACDWVLTIFPGHLFDVARGTNNLSVAYSFNAVPSPDSSSAGAGGQPLSGFKRSHGDMTAGDLNNFAFAFHLLPHKDAKLAAGVGGWSSSTDAIRIFRERAAASSSAASASSSDTFDIVIKTMTGESFSLHVHADDTIKDVKQRMQEKKSVPGTKQNLLFAGKVLQEGRTLRSYNVRKGSKLVLIWRSPAKGSMQIHVRIDSKKLVVLDVLPGETIENVKAMMEHMERFPPHLQYLFYAGKRLEDDRTLSDYSIRAGSIIGFYVPLS